MLLTEGRYLCGFIQLHSGVELRIESDAVLLGSTNGEDFPPIETEFWKTEFAPPIQRAMLYLRRRLPGYCHYRAGKNRLSGMGLPERCRRRNLEKMAEYRCFSCKNGLLYRMPGRSYRRYFNDRRSSRMEFLDL